MRQKTHPDPVGFETLENFSNAAAVNRWMYDGISAQVHGRVLEIGSGIGNISTYLLANYPDVTLSDLRPEYCQILKQKFDSHPSLRGVAVLDLSIPDFRDRYTAHLQQFDTLIALNVLEHIADDLAAITNASALLRDKGKLILLVPANPSLYNTLDRELGHYRRYTQTGLRKLIEAAGLQFTGFLYFNAAAIPGWWFAGNMLRQKIISPAKLRCFNQLVPIFRILDRVASPFTGISLISTAVNL